MEHRLQGVPRSHYIGTRPVVTGDGGLLIPIEGLGERGQSLTLAAISPDAGRSMRPATAVAADPSGDIGYGDPRLAQFDDGEIVMLLWAYHQASEQSLPVHRCVSTDYGRTWSAPASTRPVLTGPGTDMGARLLRADVGSVRRAPARNTRA